MGINGISWFTGYRRIVVLASRWIEVVGMVALMAMVASALTDVVGSKAFKWPLPGGTEIIGVLQVVAISAGLGYSYIEGRHINVSFLIDKLSGRGQAALSIFITLLSLGLFGVAGWMTFQLGINLYDRGTETMLLAIPHYPFAFWIFVGCIPIILAIIMNLLTAIEKVTK
jgi:TRAP-type C4-dicarboxylate transport system permease small subunit